MIPRDYGEISKLYSVELSEASQRTGLELPDLLSKLEGKGLLSDFEEKLPELLKLNGEDPVVLTSQESRRFLGLPQLAWSNLLSLVTGETPSELGWENVCPSLTQGSDVWDKRALFWGPDIGRLGKILDDLYAGPRKVRECSHVTEAFKALLVTTLSTILPEAPVTNVTVIKPILAAPQPALPSRAGWPVDLPENNTALVAEYGTCVAQHVNRICKIRSQEELDDVCQQMWISLFAVNILEKFVKAAKTKLPRTMTLSDTLGYLGIKHSQWVTAVTRNNKNQEYWVPLPINGSRTSLEALYRTEDIKALDDQGFLENNRTEPKVRPEVSSRGFKSYLLKAVSNHFKNYLRTKSRRHKERTSDPRNVFAQDGGVYHKVSSIEEGTSWEDSLSIAEMSAEDMCDLVCNLKKFGVDPRSDQGISILDYMSQGYTLKEAIKAQGRSALRQKTLDLDPLVTTTA